MPVTLDMSRTSDPLLRRQLLYPLNCKERVALFHSVGWVVGVAPGADGLGRSLTSRLVSRSKLRYDLNEFRQLGTGKFKNGLGIGNVVAVDEQVSEADNCARFRDGCEDAGLVVADSDERFADYHELPFDRRLLLPVA